MSKEQKSKPAQDEPVEVTIARAEGASESELKDIRRYREMTRAIYAKGRD